MICVMILYGLIRTFVLRSPNSFKRAFYVSCCMPMLMTYQLVAVLHVATCEQAGYADPTSMGSC